MLLKSPCEHVSNCVLAYITLRQPKFNIEASPTISYRENVVLYGGNINKWTG